MGDKPETLDIELIKPEFVKFKTGQKATETDLDYKYKTPSGAVTPATGEANQANDSLGIVRFHAVDAIGGDNTAFLSGVGPGWKIQPGLASSPWDVVAVALTDCYEIQVTPEQQSMDGYQTFIFMSPPEPIGPGDIICICGNAMNYVQKRRLDGWHCPFCNRVRPVVTQHRKDPSRWPQDL